MTNGRKEPWTSLMVEIIIQKYQNNPTSTGLDTKDYPIMNIEFPGITICPNTKVKLVSGLSYEMLLFKDHEKCIPNRNGIQTSPLEKSDIKTWAGVPVPTTDLSQQHGQVQRRSKKLGKTGGRRIG